METYKEEWIGQIEAGDESPKKIIWHANGPDEMEPELVDAMNNITNNLGDDETPY